MKFTEIHLRENSKKYHIHAFFYKNGVICSMIDILKFLANFKLILIKKACTQFNSSSLFYTIKRLLLFHINQLFEASGMHYYLFTLIASSKLIDFMLCV